MMNYLIDTHAHLYDDSFDNDRKEVMERALQAGVQKIYLPNCDSSTTASLLQLCAEYPQHCFPMLGLHPVYVKENVDKELTKLKSLMEQHSFAAIGEIGLDYYWDKTFVAQQKEAFAEQISWANENKLPIVIHSRDSTADCIEWVKKYKSTSLTGIFHCFSGTLDEAQEIIKLGFYLGIGGVVTYKKSTLPEILKVIGLERVVLETDAPYLAPVPYRGKRNESSYLVPIVQQMASLLSCEEEEVVRKTTANANAIFSAAAD